MKHHIKKKEPTTLLYEGGKEVNKTCVYRQRSILFGCGEWGIWFVFGRRDPVVVSSEAGS